MVHQIKDSPIMIVVYSTQGAGVVFFMESGALDGDVTPRTFGVEVEALMVSKTPGIGPGRVIEADPVVRGCFDLACHELARDVI